MHDELYALYARCFPDYPVSREEFSDAVCPGEGSVLLRREGGRLSGFSIVHENSIALLCVEPESRKLGIGSDLLRESEEVIRAGGGSRVILGRGAHYLFQGVPAETGEAVRFFSRRGYAAEWTSVNMRMNLHGFCADALEIPPSPPDITYRLAEKADAPSLLRAVRKTESGWEKYFDGSDPVMLAVHDGEAVGFAILTAGGARFPGGDPYPGSIGCVGVIPEMRSRGIGRQVVVHGIEWLIGRGCTSAELLYVELVNWYGKIGFQVYSRQWMGEKSL